jgi:hypothetical protein
MQNCVYESFIFHFAECDVSFVVVYAEFLLHRVVFFVLGLVLMVVAHALSDRVPSVLLWWSNDDQHFPYDTDYTLSGNL